MVYVGSDGRVHQNPPWSIHRLKDIFWGIIAFVIYFFQSLVGLDNTGGNRSNGGRGGGGGGNGPGGGPKRIGRVTTIDDCSMPGGG